MPFKSGLLHRNNNFKQLWLAKSGSLTGDWFNQVALGQVTLSLTHSPAAMGWVLLCRSLPAVVLGPFVSPVVDRYSKKAIMILSDSIRAAVALTFPTGYLLNLPALLYIGALLLGTAGVLFGPAQQAALPALVSAGDLPEANAFDSGTSGVISIIGALCGGVVSSLFSPVVCFMMNALSYAWSAICIFKMDWTEKRLQHAASGSYFYALRQGFAEVSANRTARAIILIGISWGFAGGGYAILIPILGEMTYHMGGYGIGLLYAVDGLGVLLGALFVRRFVGSQKKKANIFYGAAYLTQALFFALLAQFSVFALGALMLLLMRISSGIIIPLDSYLLQTATKPEVRGRIFSLHTSTYSGVMQLSYAWLGYFFERVGVPAMGLAIGLISLLCGLSWLFQIRHMASEHPDRTVSQHHAH